MKFMPGMFGHYQEWRVDRLDPRPPRLTASMLRKRRGRR
jgi:hypothetical protein